MNALTIIHDAAAAGVDLNVRGGKLYIAPGEKPMLPELLTAIRSHKSAIVQALTVWPQIATIRTVTLDRCRPLTPDNLTNPERAEVETLAAELAESGGLGWFVICLIGRWNYLSDRDRLAAAWCWELAVVSRGIAVAA